MPYNGATTLTSAPSFITKNRLGIYILNLRIPAHIRHQNPGMRASIQRSLHTRNRREALSAARKMVVWMENNSFNIEEYEQEQEMKRGAYLLGIGIDLFKNFKEVMNRGNPFEIDGLQETLTPLEMDAIQYMAYNEDIYLEKFEEIFSTGDAAKLSQFIHNIHPSYKDTILKALEKKKTEIGLRNLMAPRGNEGTSTTKCTKPSAPSRDIKLDVAFDLWKKDCSESMAKSSFEEYTRMLELFIRIITHNNNNEIPLVSELNVTMVEDYKTIFEKLPKRIRTNEKTIEDLIKIQGEPKSPSTISNTYTNLGHFTNWLAKKQYPIEDNVVKFLPEFRKIKRKEKKRRKPFDEADLKALFNSDNYSNGTWKRASEYWVPLIALFTGMTRNEIIQLTCDDIKKAERIYVFDVNANDGKQLKVDSGDSEESTGRARLVPIHSQLKSLGLLEFVEHQKKKGHLRLFPCEERNSRGHFGAYGNRFRNYRNKVKAGPRDDKELRDFHSFRHLVKTELMNNSTSEGLIDDIIGHTSKNRAAAGMTYVHTERVKLKYDLIKELKYECIDFNLIKKWTQNPFG